MANSDLVKLIKMMEMTRSENDNQCLVAIRTANSLLEKLTGSSSWSDILSRQFTIAADPFSGLSAMPQMREAAPPPPRPNGRPAAPSPPPRSPRFDPDLDIVAQAKARQRQQDDQAQRDAAALAAAQAASRAARADPMHAQAAPSTDDYQQGQRSRKNAFRTVCFKCNQWVQVRDGWLDHKSRTSDTWKICCIDDTACSTRQRSASRKSRGGAYTSPDILGNMLD